MKTKERISSLLFFGYLILAAVFLIMKMIRGFSGSDEVGGIWNVIQLFFVASGIVALFLKDKTFMSFRCVAIYLVFFLYIWFLSLFSIPNGRMTVSQIFSFATIPYGVLVLIVFYSVSIKTDIKQHWWILMAAFYVITVILFVAMRDFRVLSGDQGALADVYYVVTVLPLALLYTPKRLKLIPFILASVVVAMTGKRGAFLAMGLVMVVYFLLPIYEDRNKASRTSNMFIRLVTFVFIFVIVWYVINGAVGQFSLNIFDRLDRMEEDGGSGRMDRWLLISDLLSGESNAINLLFGHGSGAVVRLIGGHAHNDFLEFFYNYGFFAFLMYVSFFVSMIIEGLRMYRNKYIYAREFVCSVGIAICMSIFSFYAIDCTHITASSICFGLILADWYKFKKVNNV